MIISEMRQKLRDAVVEMNESLPSEYKVAVQFGARDPEFEARWTNPADGTAELYECGELISGDTEYGVAIHVAARRLVVTLPIPTKPPILISSVRQFFELNRTVLPWVKLTVLPIKNDPEAAMVIAVQSAHLIDNLNGDSLRELLSSLVDSRNDLCDNSGEEYWDKHVNGESL